MKLSSLEKQVLYLKYHKENINSKDIKLRLSHIDNELKRIQEDRIVKKKLRDINQVFKEEFGKLKRIKIYNRV